MIPSQHGVQDFLRICNSTFLPVDGEAIDYLEGRRAYTDVLDHPLSSRFFDLADIHDRPGIEIGVG